MMNDADRADLAWTVQYVEPGQRDDHGLVIPRGWWVLGFEADVEQAVASIHVSHHQSGAYAAASLAAVTAQVLNNFENGRQVGRKQETS